MKAILEFDLTEEREEFEQAANAYKYSSLLWEIEQEVFRPARKHGYSGEYAQELNALLNHENEVVAQAVADAIHFLEQRYYNFKKDRFTHDA